MHAHTRFSISSQKHRRSGLFQVVEYQVVCSDRLIGLCMSKLENDTFYIIRK